MKAINWNELSVEEKAYFRGLVKAYLNDIRSIPVTSVDENQVREHYRDASSYLNTDEPILKFGEEE